MKSVLALKVQERSTFLKSGEPLRSSLVKICFAKRSKHSFATVTQSAVSLKKWFDYFSSRRRHSALVEISAISLIPSTPRRRSNTGNPGHTWDDTSQYRMLHPGMDCRRNWHACSAATRPVLFQGVKKQASHGLCNGSGADLAASTPTGPFRS